MNRRKSFQLIGGPAIEIVGLVFADWKLQIFAQLSHKGFFTLQEEETISAIADTIILDGHPPDPSKPY